MTAARQLEEAGLGPITNLEGGILSWARDVEPGLPVV
jgi:rhodanese-related sulfurtransferase